MPSPEELFCPTKNRIDGHAYVIPRDEDSERGPQLFVQVGNDGPPLNVPVNRGQMAAILLWAARHLAKWGKA